MDRQYKDSDGNDVTLDKMCRVEPAWAANRIRTLESALQEARKKIRDLQDATMGIAAVLAETKVEITILREERDEARHERDQFRIENERLKVLISELGSGGE